MKRWYNHQDGTLILTLYIQPGAKRTEIAGLHGDALKIRLASPPVDGRANEALLRYIAGLFNVPIRQVELQRGDRSRRKVVLVTGSKITPDSIS